MEEPPRNTTQCKNCGHLLKKIKEVWEHYTLVYNPDSVKITTAVCSHPGCKCSKPEPLIKCSVCKKEMQEGIDEIHTKLDDGFVNYICKECMEWEDTKRRARENNYDIVDKDGALLNCDGVLSSMLAASLARAEDERNGVIK